MGCFCATSGPEILLRIFLEEYSSLTPPFYPNSLLRFVVFHNSFHHLRCYVFNFLFCLQCLPRYDVSLLWEGIPLRRVPCPIPTAGTVPGTKSVLNKYFLNGE